jgi:hypothetical protein
MIRNASGQKWRVLAYNVTTGSRVTGDAANITANIRKDFGARVATNDVNPTETEDGYYDFDLTASETNADTVDLFPESSTPNVLVVPVPASYNPISPSSGPLTVIGSGIVGTTLAEIPISVVDYSIGPKVKLYLRNTDIQIGTVGGYPLSVIKLPKYYFDATGLTDGDYDVYLAAPSTLTDLQDPWALKIIDDVAFIGDSWSQLEGGSQPAPSQVPPTAPSGPLGTIPYTITSLDEMEREFSVSGVRERRDDYSSMDQAYEDLITEIVYRATMDCKVILNKIYDDEDIYSNYWIRERATLIACYKLSIRRGHDSQYYASYIQALDDLKALVDGDIFLDVPRKTDSVVSLHNVYVDNRSPLRSIKVDRINSTDIVGVPYESLSAFTPFPWL